MITTDRLVLRPFEPSDLPAYATVLQDERTMALRGGPYDLATAQLALGDHLEHRAAHGYAPFAVLLDGALVGDAGLQLLEEGPDVELRYRLASSVWRRGIATEAAGASLDHGFETLGLDEIVAVIAPDNVASLRTAACLGFVRGELGEWWGHKLIRHTLSRAQHEARRRRG